MKGALEPCFVVLVPLVRAVMYHRWRQTCIARSYADNTWDFGWKLRSIVEMSEEWPAAACLLN